MTTPAVAERRSLNSERPHAAIDSSGAPARPWRRLATLALEEPGLLDRALYGLPILAGDLVLDLGCADGRLVLQLAGRFPHAAFFGLDPDQRDLSLARANLDAAGVRADLSRGPIFAPPFLPTSFQCIVSAQLLHRLTIEEKIFSIRAAYRLLKPGGVFRLIDWGRTQGYLERAAMTTRRLLHRLTLAPISVERALLVEMLRVGFVKAAIDLRQRTAWGTVCTLTGQRPHRTCASR